MDFRLSEDDLMIKETAAELAEKRIYPNAEKWDESEEPPKELFAELAELGYFGMMLPEKYGGLELPAVTFNLALEEICAASAGVGILLSVHNSLCCDGIYRFGSDELKDAYLPRMASGELIGAYCLTEPEAGSDAGSLSTAAIKDGDDYIINGNKVFVTNAALAGLFVVFTRTDPAAGSKGISAFVVDRDANGIEIGAPEKKMGLKSSDTRQVAFTDVRVPAKNMIGEPGFGFKMALTLLNNGRIGVAFQSIGIARSALAEAIKYAKERKQFGKPISSFQAIQFKLSKMATELEAGRLLGLQAAALKDAGEEHALQASMAKLYCSQMCNRVANEAVQIHGGYGYMKEYAVERYFRDARVTEIYEGTSEVQQIVIARHLLKD
jgi:hypothetical protein